MSRRRLAIGTSRLAWKATLAARQVADLRRGRARIASLSRLARSAPALKLVRHVAGRQLEQRAADRQLGVADAATGSATRSRPIWVSVDGVAAAAVVIGDPRPAPVGRDVAVEREAEMAGQAVWLSRVRGVAAGAAPVRGSSGCRLASKRPFRVAETFSEDGPVDRAAERYLVGRGKQGPEIAEFDDYGSRLDDVALALEQGSAC